MKNFVCIQIRGDRKSSASFELKSLGLAIKKQVEAYGAICLPIWADSSLTIALEGVPPAKIESLLGPFIESFRKRRGVISIVQNDAAKLPVRGLPSDFCQPGAIIREPLTRRFLFSLPEGAFVARTIYPNGRCAFAERLEDVRSRGDSWLRAVAAGAAHLHCQVVWTGPEFTDAVSGNQ
jgi:hypothetical protein